MISQLLNLNINSETQLQVTENDSDLQKKAHNYSQNHKHILTLCNLVTRRRVLIKTQRGYYSRHRRSGAQRCLIGLLLQLGAREVGRVTACPGPGAARARCQWIWRNNRRVPRQTAVYAHLYSELLPLFTFERWCVYLDRDHHSIHISPPPPTVNDPMLSYCWANIKPHCDPILG